MTDRLITATLALWIGGVALFMALGDTMAPAAALDLVAAAVLWSLRDRRKRLGRDPLETKLKEPA